MITENKKYTLKELTSLRSGLYRKGSPKGEVYQIQKGNFDEEGKLLPLPKVPELEMESSFKKHFLKTGEVLVNAKGETNVAYLFPEVPQPAVASSVFLILTLKSKQLSAAYLAWYLNTKQCQHTLAKLSRGSAVHSLAKRDLQQVVIPLPSLRIQNAIVHLAELQRKERSLYLQLITEKANLAEAHFLQLSYNSSTT